MTKVYNYNLLKEITISKINQCPNKQAGKTTTLMAKTKLTLAAFNH